jgi:hypothetical protein
VQTAQVWGPTGVISHVQRLGEPQHLELIENVRCLECGTTYSKPADGGTVATNPGCPECSYLGWIPVTQAFVGPRAGELRPAS